MDELLFALIPMGIMLLARFFHPQGKDLTMPEFAAAGVVCVALGFGLVAVGKSSQTIATELWNGQVTDKTFDMVYYSRPYDCNCRTVTSGTGKNKTSSKVCQTCYDKGHDMYWDVESNIGNFRIRHRDCDSTSKSYCRRRYDDPQFWTDAQKGDPVSKQNRYTNWIRAVDTSLFNFGQSGPQSKVPTLEYPIQVYDHYSVDRVLTDGITPPQDIALWNAGLAEILKTLGPQKQANMILVLTDAGNPSYADLLIQKWKGANKNDIVIVAGFPMGNMLQEPNWVKVHAWAKKDIMNVEMRDALLDNTDWWKSPDAFFPNVQNIVMEKFERRPMKEFEYLKNRIELSTGQKVLFGILAAIIGAVMSLVLIIYDVFGGLRKSPRGVGRNNVPFRR